MEIRSRSFDHDDVLPDDYTCRGTGSPPPLEWSDVPEAANSLVLICDDPDAPGGTFYHWGVYDIPPDVTSLPADPKAVDFPHATNDTGERNYYPPCPPEGDGPHSYRFHILAIDAEELDFVSPPTVEELLKKAEPHLVDRGMIQARFQQ